MELEAKAYYSPKLKEYAITKILKLSEADLVKAYLIRKSACLDEDFIFEYLENKHEVILAYYVELSLPNSLLIPSPKSGSYWSQLELSYYSIKIVESDEKAMFGSEDINLSPNVKEFLGLHTDEFLRNYKFLVKTPNFSMFSNFASAFMKYTLSSESRVADLITAFFLSVCENDFFVQRHVPHGLYVGDCEKDARSDISLCDVVTGIDGVVLLEDKTFKHKLEAQLIATGIAVAQQVKWKEEWTVHMISTVGSDVTFYTAVFPKKLLENVKNGFLSQNQTTVAKLNRTFDLANSRCREDCAWILKRILVDLRKRR